MMATEVLSLITTTSDGTTLVEASRKQIYGDQMPVRSSDFRAAQASGIKVQEAVKIYAFEYSGETEVYYKDKYFSVDRTYQPSPDWIELYLVDSRPGL